MITSTVKQGRALTPIQEVFSKYREGRLDNGGTIDIDRSIVEEHNGFLRPILAAMDIPISSYREVMLLNNIVCPFSIRVPSNSEYISLRIPPLHT